MNNGNDPKCEKNVSCKYIRCENGENGLKMKYVYANFLLCSTNNRQTAFHTIFRLNSETPMFATYK